MPYAAPTVTKVGPTEWEVQITGTNIANGDSVAVDGLPLVGTVIRVQSAITAGTGTTTDPIITRTTPPSAAAKNDIVVVPVAPADLAASADVRGSAPYRATTQVAGLGTATLYFSARPNAGADNTIVASFLVTGTGW